MKKSKTFCYVLTLTGEVEDDLKMCRKLAKFKIPVLSPGLKEGEWNDEPGKVRWAISPNISDEAFVSMISMEEFYSIEKKFD